MGARVLEHFHWPHDGAPIDNAGLSEILAEQARLERYIEGRLVAWRRAPEWLHERLYDRDCRVSVLVARGVFCETEEERISVQDALNNPSMFLANEGFANAKR